MKSTLDEMKALVAEDINDEFSEKVYHDFLSDLDPRKRYFLQEDLDSFDIYKDKIDDQIQNHKIDFFSVTYDKFQQRLAEAETYYPEILAQPFDFSSQEEINTNYDDMAYASSKEELKKRWKTQLKFATLANFYDLKQEQKAKAENEEDFQPKSDEELEKEAREMTKTALDESFDINDDLGRKDWFSVYLNAIVEEFDPHTFYFAPRDKERFAL